MWVGVYRGLGGVALVFLLVDRIFFIQNVCKLSGIKDFAAGLTLDELNVFLASDNTNLGVFAHGRHGKALAW